MKKLIFLILLFWTNLSSFAAQLKLNIPANSGDFITAKINNKAITNSELIDRYRYVVTSAKISIQSIDDQKLLLNQILDKMVDEELIRQEAATLKIETTPEEVGDAVEMVALQQKKNPTQFKIFFINNGFSFDHYLKQIEAEILWSKIISETLRSKVKVTEVEVREFFEQHKFNTDVKKFYVAEILISPTGKSAQTAEQFAAKLAIELRQGADFKNLVKQFSNGINAENNGEIGWVSQSDIEPKIYNAISKLNKGGYSDPVSLSDGFHIFKLFGKRNIIFIFLNSGRNSNIFFSTKFKQNISIKI